MGYVKNLFLIIVFVGLGALAISYFGVMKTDSIVPAGQIYGHEYGSTMQKLKDVNIEMEEAEQRLAELARQREELIDQGDQIIRDSFERAHQEQQNNQPAIEPITGDIDVGLYN